MSHLRFASLGSGSRGNATLVEAGDTRVLIDNGFSARECGRRLARLGVAAETLTAVLVTHEHSDHAAGVVALAARHRLPVYLTAGTHRVMEQRGLFAGVEVECRRVLRGIRFAVGALAITPVRVPHDAQEPCQYFFEAGGARLGVLTDLGSVTPQVVDACSGCDALLLECNHDAGMLAGGPYPQQLKTRVGGDFGHLSNRQAGELLQAMDVSQLRTLVIGHLSEQNNEALLARRGIAAALGWAEERIVVASQAEGHGWLTVSGEEARVAGTCGA